MEDEVLFDSIEDILCRLPVKSVVRFKGVCRRWLSLIKDPKFIKLHQRSTQSHTDQGSLVTLKDNQLCSVDLSTLRITKEAINHPLSKLPDRICLEGACNGLLCLSGGSGDNYRMVLWNMSTKEHKILPPVPDYGLDFGVFELGGFGYDPCNDDYKVVRVHYCPRRGNRAMFYSLRLDSWSWGSNYKHEYHNFRQFRFLSWAGVVYAGGALNWMARPNNTIVGIDLNTENVRDLRFPSTPHDTFRIDSIGVLEGKLCVACSKEYWYGPKEVMDIWVMEEYGQVESWTKLFSIRPYITRVGATTSIN
ncbi:hypothetical protein COLO4_09399 [Corchorus olitorius]|uniref:Uncharacterized protein n=1 Tax=Corchorus olitorius TaxID=93759 RepID=A0A1R3KC90_9ROSI|nr:hypothetical protein COLO4_09399 [Corchorus olitorius]